ncbi:hypothetical protein E8E12_006108 [Didymella heteroderae]|uniref:Uncharacterized protein n=1 Tax=Didymella heteroderae TaxID=1769908 RepID=A0A9P5BY05_9PLEO|nr:hypothetical protein E8E12_006108 [Didymella heteroderae]
MKALDQAFIDNGISKRLTLLELPPELNTTEFVNGNMHPILTTHGYGADIRQSALQINGPLLTSSTMIPFKPLLAPLNAYIGGEDKNTLDALRLAGILPSIVSTLLGGIKLRLGDFFPPNAAYQADGNGGFFANSKWVVLPNPISGPGVYPEAVDTAFKNTSDPRYSFNFWNSLVNQPVILKGAMTGHCQQNSFFFNESTVSLQFRFGDATLGPAASGVSLTKSVLQGKYTNVLGFSACAQNVGFAAQKCKDLE